MPFLLRLTVNNTLLGAGDFSWIFPHGTELTVAPGQTLTIAVVRFRPSALGERISGFSFWSPLFCASFVPSGMKVQFRGTDVQ